MPALKKVSLSPKWQNLREQLNADGDRRSCSVVALTLLCHCTPKEAQDALAAEGRKHNDGAYVSQILRAAERLGYTTRQITAKEKVELHNRYPAGRRNFKHFTTHHPRRFAKAWEGMPDMFLFMAGHVSAYVEGEVVDWAVNSSRQIYSMYVVTKKEG